MFNNKLLKTLARVNDFIKDLETGIESNKKSIESNQDKIETIQTESDNLSNQCVQAQRLVNTLNG